MKRTTLAWAAGLLVVVLFALLVWPTLYRYDHIETGPGQSLPVRTNRFTGFTEILYPDGWTSASASPKRETLDRDLGRDDLRQLDAEATTSFLGQLHLDLYNGSRFKIDQIRVEVSFRNAGHQEVSRRSYLLHRTPSLAPEQGGSFETDFGLRAGTYQSWVCRIVAARGTLTAQVPTYKPSRSSADMARFALTDPTFWKLSEEDQRAVFGHYDWDFATKTPAEQAEWLKQQREKFLKSQANEEAAPK